MNKCICILVVSFYSDKSNIIDLIGHAIKNDRVKEFVFVNNGGSLDYLNDFLKNDVVFYELKNKFNNGSAGGFKQGIEFFVRHCSSNYLLILDDDLWVCADNIERYYKTQANYGMGDNIFLFGVRKGMTRYYNVAKGIFPSSILSYKNSFVRFSINDIISMFFFRLFRKKREIINPIKIINGYWGGLFSNKQTLSKQNLPIVDLFLYKDDVIYTFMAGENGVNLYLCPAIEIQESRVSWTRAINKKIFPESSIGDDFRKYYSIRNTVYFEWHIRKFRNINYLLNGFIYLIVIIVENIGNFNNLKIIFKAIYHGFKSDLGIKYHVK